jgi:hypothetical protein
LKADLEGSEAAVTRLRAVERLHSELVRSEQELQTKHWALQVLLFNSLQLQATKVTSFLIDGTRCAQEFRHLD